MFKKISLLVLVSISTVLNAQTKEEEVKPWKLGGVGSFTFSQFASDKWQGAPDNSLTGITILNLFANYKKDSTLNWENALNFNYGIQRINKETQKTEDKIQLISKFGRRATKTLFYSAQVSFETQVADGKKDEEGNFISRPLAPAYLILSVGMDYKPNEYFTVLFAPVTGKATFVNDDSLSARGAFGVEPGENSRYEFGGFLTASASYEIVKNVNTVFKINFFSNYAENPTSIDVDAELKIDMKINKFLSTSFIANMKYDEDVAVMYQGKEVNSLVQWKEVFGLSLTYKF
jgi:hypothetical protein